MVALLYGKWLCLATAGKFDQIYTIQACIALTNIKVEDVDNGRGMTSRMSQFPLGVANGTSGLQCHTARHSWKIVFLSDNELYELILTACSPKEELEWTARLKSKPKPRSTDDQDQTQSEPFNFLALNIKPLGTVFRKPGMLPPLTPSQPLLTPYNTTGSMARKISIHRATTIGPKSPLYQVILKNTSATTKDPPPTSSPTNPSSLLINRSQSLLTTNARVPVLAPPRAERARLEALLADVWTRDVIPFPGIIVNNGAGGGSGHLVRASASSVMRKLSAVSIAGGFARRSASWASLQGGQPQQQQQTSPQKGNREKAATMSSATGDGGEGFAGLMSAGPAEGFYGFAAASTTTGYKMPGAPPTPGGGCAPFHFEGVCSSFPVLSAIADLPRPLPGRTATQPGTATTATAPPLKTHPGPQHPNGIPTQLNTKNHPHPRRGTHTSTITTSSTSSTSSDALEMPSRPRRRGAVRAASAPDECGRRVLADDDNHEDEGLIVQSPGAMSPTRGEFQLSTLSEFEASLRDADMRRRLGGGSGKPHRDDHYEEEEDEEEELSPTATPTRTRREREVERDRDRDRDRDGGGAKNPSPSSAASSPSQRSRSSRLSGKLARAGLRRREMLVEGIRSWFR